VSHPLGSSLSLDLSRPLSLCLKLERKEEEKKKDDACEPKRGGNGGAAVRLLRTEKGDVRKEKEKEKRRKERGCWTCMREEEIWVVHMSQGERIKRCATLQKCPLA
jgi:hypothetical protein